MVSHQQQTSIVLLNSPYIFDIRNNIVEYNMQFKINMSVSGAQKFLNRYFVKQVKDDPSSSPFK